MAYGPSAPSNGTVDTSAIHEGVRVRMRTLDASAIERNRSELSAWEPESTLPPRDSTGPYRLGVSDVVTVAVWNHPELSIPFGEFRTDLTAGSTINENGEIFYPHAGKIQAAGLTTTELREALIGKISHVLNNPQLDVRIMAFRSQKVIVSGAVGSPSSIAITDVPLTLMDALAQARGVNPPTLDGNGGDISRIELQRDGVVYRLDLTRSNPAAPDPSRLRLRNGDMIRVPSAGESRVYVLGEVSQQQAVPMANGSLTIAGAIARAGGISLGSAAASRVYLVRATSPSSLDVWRLDARNPLSIAIADRFPLRSGDILYVDRSGLVAWNRVVSLLLPTAQLVNSIGSSALQYQELTR
jgi:polysaccharide export outer membrane protein